MRLSTFAWLTAFACLATSVFAEIASNSNEARDNSTESLKQGVGKGYGHHHDHDHPHDFIPPFPHDKPFYDTHYCSVHGSFALSYSKGESYPVQYGPPKKHYKRKYMREFCRFSSAHSAKSCQFCCKIVARSAYTNPDDIISAIFAFDPVNPTAGGVGLPRQSYNQHQHHQHKKPNPYGGNSYPQNNGPQYSQHSTSPQHGYPHQPPPHYQQPPPQGGYQPKYRVRRQSDTSPPAPPPSDSPAPESAHAIPDAPTPATYNAPESFSPVNQCVCCAPKTHFDRRHSHHHHHDHDDY